MQFIIRIKKTKNSFENKLGMFYAIFPLMLDEVKMPASEWLTSKCKSIFLNKHRQWGCMMRIRYHYNDSQTDRSLSYNYISLPQFSLYIVSRFFISSSKHVSTSLVFKLLDKVKENFSEKLLIFTLEIWIFSRKIWTACAKNFSRRGNKKIWKIFFFLWD